VQACFFSSVVIQLRTWTPYHTFVTLLIPDSQTIETYYSGVIHLQRKRVMFCAFFRKLGFVTRIKLFKAFCSSMYGCELWSLNDSRPINEFFVAWRKALRRVINVPYNYCHSCFLPLLSDTFPIFDELCRLLFRFILSCVFRVSPLYAPLHVTH